MYTISIRIIESLQVRLSSSRSTFDSTKRPLDTSTNEQGLRFAIVPKASNFDQIISAHSGFGCKFFCC